jgi:hypothetical protein
MYRRRCLPFAIILLVTLLAACRGGGDDGAPSADATPTPITAEDVLSSARDAWSETQSAHFTLAVEGEAFLDSDETIKLRSAEGDILRPDSVQATASIDVSVLVVDISLVAIGGEIYMTNFVSGRWERAPSDFSYDPSVLFSDSDGIGPILTELDDPALGANEQIEGRETRVVTGTVDAETVEEITSGAIQGEDIPVTLWIGVEDSFIYRVVLTEPEGVREIPATWTLTLSNHNAPVTIEPPPV